MGILTEPKLDEVVAAGCTSCSGGKLVFRSYVDGRLPLMFGDPCGDYTWVYDGEKFVDGVYEVRCASCSEIVFSEDCCPRCHAEGGLSKALDSENSFDVPDRCPGCGAEEVLYTGMVPVEIAYDGKPAKAKTSVELFDPGFHGYRIACQSCDDVTTLEDECPLCEAPGPLRVRP